MEKKFQPQDFAALLAQQQGITKEEALEFVRAFFELTEEALIKDSLVKVSGFGTTKLVVVNERESVNIHTGERFQIGKHTKITFTPDNTLRDLVNRPFALLTTTTLYDETPEDELDAVPSPENDISDEIDMESSSSPDFINRISDSNEISLEETQFQTINEQEIAKDNRPSRIDADAALEVPAEDSRKDDTESLNLQEKTVLNSTKAIDLGSQALSIASEKNNETSEESETLQDFNPDASFAESDASFAESTDSLEEEQEIVIIEESPECSSEQNETKEGEVNLTHRQKTTQTLPPSSDEVVPHVTNIQGEIRVKTENIDSKVRHHRTPFNVLLLAFVTLLVVLAYFAGYYHWLCPNCPQGHPPIQHLPLVSPNTSLETSSQEHTTTKSDAQRATNDSKTIPANSSKDTATKAGLTTTTTQQTPKAKESIATPQKEVSPEVQRIIVKSQQLTAQDKGRLLSKAREWQQLPHGKSMIVGTYSTHVVKAGESLPRLAKHYYGNPNYANYIILHNHIEHPDVIKVGQKLKIPQLLQ